jgi:hypothetical protein
MKFHTNGRNHPSLTFENKVLHASYMFHSSVIFESEDGRLFEWSTLMELPLMVDTF